MKQHDPRMMIDSHCHIYPDEVAKKAVESIETFYGQLPEKHPDGSVRTLIRTGRECGISRFVVHSVAVLPRHVKSVNHFIARQADSHPDIFTGLGSLHPDSETLEADFNELYALGLKGVKLHPDTQRFKADEPKAMRIYEMCQSSGLPVLVHTGDSRFDNSNPGRIANVLRQFPDLKFIGAHFGGWSVWDEARRLLPDFPNLIVDTSSSSYWFEPEKAVEMIRSYGSERVMFGTDYPYWTQQREIDFYQSLDLEQEEIEDIFWRTCTRLYGLPEENVSEKQDEGAGGLL